MPGMAGDDLFLTVQPRDIYGNNRSSLDNMDFQIQLDPLTPMPMFWVEKAAILRPTKMVTRPKEQIKAGVSTGFFNISLLIYPQGR